jgi:hypothetical protein
LRFEMLAGHAARGPSSVWKSVVPLDTLGCALFSRRRTCGELFVAAGGAPAFGERAFLARDVAGDFMALFLELRMTTPLLSCRLWTAALFDGLTLDTVARGGHGTQAGERDRTRAGLAYAIDADVQSDEGGRNFVELVPFAALQARQGVGHVLHGHILERIPRLVFQ